MVDKMTNWELWRSLARLGPREFVRGMHPCRYFEYGAAVQLIQGYQTGDSTLDIGSAFSCFPFICESFGMKVIAIDIVREGLRRLTKVGGRTGGSGCRPVQGDAARMPFPDNSFNYCSCISTLEHIPDDRAVVIEVARVLKDGGLLILTIPFSTRIGYRETHGPGAPCGFERVFDWQAVVKRIIEPSGLHLQSMQAFGESMPRCVRAHDHTHRYVRYLFFYLQPFFAHMMYAPVRADDPKATGLVIGLKKI